MHGLYRAKHAFKESMVCCEGAAARSTPTSPSAVRGGGERPAAPQQPGAPGCGVRTTASKLGCRLEKCSSEPSVFDKSAAKTRDSGAGQDDDMSASITGLSSCAGPDFFTPRVGLGSFQNIILSFEEGELFQVLSKEEHDQSEWWAVRCVKSGKAGFVPANFLEEELSPHQLPACQSLTQKDGHCALLYELRSRVADMHRGKPCAAIRQKMTVFEDIAGGGGAVLPAASMIPEADVCAPGDLHKRNRRNTGGTPPVAPPLPPPPCSAEGLILPRKPVNPCLESADHKSLHRELLFNHKIGKNVLNQKSELQRALERHKDLQAKKEIQQQKETSKSALERVIEERAKRLEMLQKSKEDAVKSPNGGPEFLQVHAKLRARMDSK